MPVYTPGFTGLNFLMCSFLSQNNNNALRTKRHCFCVFSVVGS